MFQRLINPSKSQSFFLFGPRGSGKSTFLDGFFGSEEKVVLDLLNFELASELSSYPNNLLTRLAPHAGKKPWVIIDEVQKAPQLLDLVHKLINLKKAVHLFFLGQDLEIVSRSRRWVFTRREAYLMVR